MILEGRPLPPNRDNGSSSSLPRRLRRRRRQVCLFGLSADPPTGAGGHLSIVQALRELRKQPPQEPSSSVPEPAGKGCRDEVAPAKEASSTGGVAPESPSAMTATDGEMFSNGDQLAYMFDEVWVLPVYRHTFQEKQARLADFQHRLRMCELAFLDPSSSSTNETNAAAAEEASRRQDGGRPRLVVSDAEYRSWEAAVERAREQCRRTQTRFDPANLAVGTASLLDYLQGEHPDVDFHFCLGADSFWDLVRGAWKESERVLRSFRGKLWVVHRAGLTDNDDADEDDPSTTAPHRPSVESADVGARALLVSDATSVSSTLVRRCRDMEELSRLLPDPVLQYIKANSLYAFAATGVL